MASYKDRLVKAFPVISKMFKASRPLVRETIVAGAAAGNVAVPGIRRDDEIISVINLTALTDLTSEFTMAGDGLINNTGGTSTAGANVKVMWHPWTH